MVSELMDLFDIALQVHGPLVHLTLLITCPASRQYHHRLPGHPRCFVVAPVLVLEGIASHQWLHPPLHEAEGHMLGPQPGLFKGLDLLH
jgi:hypothetical protein